MKNFFARLFASHPAAIIASLCMVSLTIPASVWLWREQANVGAVPRALAEQGAQTRAFLGELVVKQVMPPVSRMVGTVDALPGMARQLIDRHATRIENKLDAQLSGMRCDAVQVANAANARVGEALAVLDGRAKDALSLVSGVRADLQPVLSNSAALVKDAQDSLDDSYDDLRGLVQSGEVATTQVAQTMQTVNAHVGPVTDAVTGVAQDVHDATRNLDVKYFHPPKLTFWGKVKQVVSDLEALLLAALRGGVL